MSKGGADTESDIGSETDYYDESSTGSFSRFKNNRYLLLRNGNGKLKIQNRRACGMISKISKISKISNQIFAATDSERDGSDTDDNDDNDDDDDDD
jgi:hypothetical protein